MKPAIRQLVALVLILFSTACGNQDEVNFTGKPSATTAIKDGNGLYWCADQNADHQILANRKSVGEWERFSVKYLEGDAVTLLAYNQWYVGSSHDAEGQLSANFLHPQDNAIFKVVQINSSAIVLKDFKNRYVRVDSLQFVKADGVHIEDAAPFYLTQVPSKKFSYFTSAELIPLVVGLLLILGSLIAFFYLENKRLSIFLLLLGALSVRLFTALLGAHLHYWDEQFHALVAKHMMDNPFTPILYKNPVIPYDEFSWVEGHIWLHKQPLFLWQMALSMKLFGANLFGLRLPSVFMSTIVVFFIYRLGKLSVNSTVGYIAALLFALSNFSIEIASGAIHTDHNDVAFLFYVAASVWAWVEYEHSESPGKKYFLVLIGLFAGCAVLVKWLTGVLVFSGWGLSVLLSKTRQKKWVHYRDIIIAFAIAVVVFLPWQIHILQAFPEISRYEFGLNSHHFFEVVEKHGGDFWWHFNRAKDIYGVPFIFVLLGIVALFTSVKNVVIRTAFLTYIILIYTFFGFAATKMIAFTYCISFLVFIGFGALMEKFFKVLIFKPAHLPKQKHQAIFAITVLGILSALNLNVEKIQSIHTLWKKDEHSHLFHRMRTTPIIKGLAHEIPQIEKYVIFNCSEEDNIPIMFFTNAVAAYSTLPDEEIVARLKQQGMKIAVFDDGDLPSYLLDDEDTFVISGYWKPHQP